MPPRSHSVIRDAYRAFAARDVDALRELAHADVEIRTMTALLAGRREPYRGHEGVAHYIADVSRVWDELELDPVDFHELDTGGVLVFGRVRARRGSMRVDSANAWLWHLRDGKIELVEVFGDPSDAAALVRSAPG